MAVIVHHPRPEFTGTARIGRATLRFVDGVAPADGVNVAAFRRAGYEVAVVSEQTYADQPEEPVVIDERTFADPVESDEDPDVVDE